MASPRAILTYFTTPPFRKQQQLVSSSRTLYLKTRMRIILITTTIIVIVNTTTTTTIISITTTGSAIAVTVRRFGQRRCWASSLPSAPKTKDVGSPFRRSTSALGFEDSPKGLLLYVRVMSESRGFIRDVGSSLKLGCLFRPPI